MFRQKENISSLFTDEIFTAKIFVFFLENPSFGMLTTLKIGKDLILHKKCYENSKCLLQVIENQ